MTYSAMFKVGHDIYVYQSRNPRVVPGASSVPQSKRFFAIDHASITQKKKNVIRPLEIHQNLKLKYILQNYPKQTLPDRFRLITIIIIKNVMKKSF